MSNEPYQYTAVFLTMAPASDDEQPVVWPAGVFASDVQARLLFDHIAATPLVIARSLFGFELLTGWQQRHEVVRDHDALQRFFEHDRSIEVAGALARAGIVCLTHLLTGKGLGIWPWMKNAGLINLEELRLQGLDVSTAEFDAVNVDAGAYGMPPDEPILSEPENASPSSVSTVAPSSEEQP